MEEVKKIRIKKINIIKNEDVYDISVKENHNFFANKILVHNCGEIPLCSYDSCRLLSVNLINFVVNPFTENAYFDFDLFKIKVRHAMKYMDDIIDLEIEKIDKIIEKIDSDIEPEHIKNVERNLWLNIKEKSINGRRTGLGFTAEGDMLAALGYRYGTDEGNEFAEKVQKTLAIEAYKTSIDLAQERGKFNIYDENREKNNPFIKRIKENLDEYYLSKLKQYGRRNIALLTCAPNGTIGVVTQTTSGIEPVFLPVYTRRKKINPNDKDARIDFVDEVGDKWTEYQVFHYYFEEWAKIKGYDIENLKTMNAKQIAAIVKESPYYKATSNDVDWVKKVELQGRLQKWIDHSISVTVNLPNNVSEELVSKVYMTGWESGCKGITIYRDGSRAGVLVSNENKSKNNIEEFITHNAPKRPKVLEADYYVTTSKGKKFGFVVGKWPGTNRPYEIFGFSNPVNLYNCKGTTTKVEKGQYRFKCDGFTIDNLELSGMNSEERTHTLAISMLLRHGAPIEHICHVAKKIDDNVVSFSSAIRRILNKYDIETEDTGEICPECGGKLIKTGGCVVCENTLPGGDKICTYSKCG